MTEAVCTPNCFRAKYADICLKAKAWMKLGHATRQLFQAQQQIYNKTARKKERIGVVMTND